ncbi:hypothetical protein [Brevibacillus brevis]|uniref:Uncharacterized protein n=1 Tax=Brevibacillus brevis TaxID=1393 RepID=A0ABY9TCS2_BREBE|nr:hypothetical protein [Brevibacillus brevis]WNC17910.1 hypothetical protein RGB73_30105 [Brevibacillus brevis]
MNKVIRFMEKHEKPINLASKLIATVGIVWICFTQQDKINPFFLSALTLPVYFGIIYITDRMRAAN